MKRQIKLNENELRNFISYSVARLLKEGANQFNSWDEISLEEDDWNYGVLKGLGKEMVEKFRQNMQQKYPDDDWSNEGGLFIDEIADWAMRKFGLKNFPDKIGVAYNSNMTNHGRGDYDEPEYWSNDLGSGWKIKDNNFEKLPEIGKRIVEAAVEHFMDYHMEDFLARELEDRDWGPDDDYEGPLDEINLPRFDDDENKDKDEYKGHKFHTPKAWEPKNPYRKKDGSFYTWDEYCELAKKDRERGEISEMIRRQPKMIKENVDSLGQYHGSLRVDQEGEFANKIFDLKRDIEDAMIDLEENGGEGDYNDAQYYLALKKARNALEDLVNFENEDY